MFDVRGGAGFSILWQRSRSWPVVAYIRLPVFIFQGHMSMEKYLCYVTVSSLWVKIKGRRFEAEVRRA